MERFANRTSHIDGERRVKFIAALGTTIVGLIVGGLIYAFGFSSWSRITEITFSGIDDISQLEFLATIEHKIAQGRIANIFGAHNFFIWPKGDIDIGYLSAQHITIEKNWIHRSIHITVQPREYYGIVCLLSDECFWFDPSGFVFERAPKTEGSFVLQIIDIERETMVVGERVMTAPLMMYFGHVVRIMNDVGFRARRIEFIRRLQELRWETFEGADILLSLRFDPTVNVSALRELQKTVSLRDVVYVDLRVNGRMYYKPL